MAQKTEYNNAYERIKYILDHSLRDNHVILVKNSLDVLKNKIDSLKKGSLIYNVSDPFLGRCKTCVGIDYDVLDREIETLYDYALKYDIFMAPKTVVFGVCVKASKFFL